MKVVLTKKPPLEGGDVPKGPAVSDQVPKGDLSDVSARMFSEMAELAAYAAYKAKCRIVVRGKYEQELAFAS